MEAKQLPSHPLPEWIQEENRVLRENAPRYFVNLIENNVLENVSSLADIETEQVAALAGDTSCGYFLRNNDKPTVVKFRTWGTTAEANALQAWRDVGARVPRVEAFGVVPITANTKPRIRYIVMEGITDQQGNPAPTAHAFIQANPDKAAEVGAAMGRELAKMHRVVMPGTVGSFSEEGIREGYASVDEFYTHALDEERSYLVSIGLTEEQVDKLKEKVGKIDFPEEGVLIHSDYGVHNVLVEQGDASKVRPFDPNAKVGDPYFDIARFLNKIALKKAEYEANPHDDKLKKDYELERALGESLIEQYKQESGIEFDEPRMLLNQIVKETRVLHYEEKKVAAGVPLSTKLRKDILKQQVGKLLGD